MKDPLGDKFDRTPPAGGVGALFRAGLLEAICILGGTIAYFDTGKVIWLAIGVLAGLGFSLPALIRYFRDDKGRDRASR